MCVCVYSFLRQVHTHKAWTGGGGGGLLKVYLGPSVNKPFMTFLCYVHIEYCLQTSQRCSQLIYAAHMIKFDGNLTSHF